MSEPDKPSLATRARREGFAYLELLALTFLAVAQPVLDAFQNGADIFVLRRASTLDVVLFALIITFVPALVLYVVEIAVSLAWRSGRTKVHAGLLGLVAAVLFIEVIGSMDGPLLWAGAIAAGVGAASLVIRFRNTQLFLRFLSLAPFVFISLFLATEPVSEIAFADVPETANGAEVADPAPVVMVVFDELPTASLLDGEDRIDPRLFPNFARLAGDSTWYRNNTGVSPTTPQAVPAIFTGNYPDDIDALPVSTNYPDSLFTLLEGAYEMNVWEQATRICRTDLCPPTGDTTETGVGRLLADAVDVWTDTLRHRTTVETQQPFKVRQSDPTAKVRFDDFVDSIESTPNNRLDVIHVLLPHQPWRYLPSGHRHNGTFITKGLTAGYTWRDPYFATAARQRHLLQLQLADAQLGLLLDRLEELDRYDESLVVVTADHGVAFTEGEPIRGLSDGNQEQVAWTPLIVKAPGQEHGEIDDQPMRTIDIVPTIADTLGVDIGWEVDGIPASSDQLREDERRFYRWNRFSDLPVEPGEDYSLIDGKAGFEGLLAGEPWAVAGDPDYWLYRFGEWGDLVGTPVGELEIGEPADFTHELEDPAREFKNVDFDYDDVDLDREILPSYIAGTIDSRDDVDIAVALNGHIAGWGPAFTENRNPADRQSFFALAPESMLRSGDNEVEVFVIGQGADGPVLHRIPLADEGKGE